MAVMGKKTAIALAVTAAMCGQVAWAADDAGFGTEPTVIDITGKPHYGVEDKAFNGNLTLIGNLEASTPAPSDSPALPEEPENRVDGVNLDSIEVAGHFINNANMTLKADGAEAIELDTMDIDDAPAPRNKVGGDIVNNGRLSVEGAAVSGINISDTDTGTNDTLTPTDDDYALGSVINNGHIEVRDSATPDHLDYDDPRAGISIENSHIKGDILNKGTISVEGDGVKGITVSRGNGNASVVDSDIVNKGSIHANGRNVEAISIRDTAFSHDIENKGTITASGDNAKAINVVNTDVNDIVNKSKIIAEGVNSVAISVSGPNGMLPVNFAMPSASVNEIINSGSIIAGGTAIDTSSASGGHFIVNDKGGLIKGDDAAIRGNGMTALQLIDSKLMGDVFGVDNVKSDGNVLIDARVFNANSLNVRTGELVIAQVMNLTGNMTIASDAKATVTIGKGVNASQPLLNVGGTLTLEEGSKIGVNANKNVLSKDTTRYILIHADDIQDLGASVVSVTPFLKVSNVEIGETTVQADIGLATGDEVINHLKDKGANHNSQRAGREFVNGVLANISEHSTLYQAFMNADDGQALRLLKDIQPENSRAAQSASLSATGLANRAIGGRMGANSGDVLAETGVWVKALYGNSDQAERGGVEGYDARSRGLIIGADGKLNEQTTLGLAFSHVRTDVSSDSHDKTDVTSNLLSVYGAWEQGAYDVQGSLSYGQSRNEAKRFVVGEKIKGNYDSSVLSADLSAGYTYKVNPSFSLTPTVASRYNRVEIDSYNEKGSAAALRMNSQSLEVFELGGGLKAAGVWGNFKPNARVMAFYDLAQDKANSSSAFLMGGNTFVTTGAPATKWTYEAGVGLDWVHGNYTIGASYDYARKAGFNADTTYLNLRYDF